MFWHLAKTVLKNLNPPTDLPRLLTEDGEPLVNEKLSKLVTEKNDG